MSWRERTAGVQAGDTVAYSRQFLQSTGQIIGDAPFVRGTVKGFTAVCGLVLAEVEWEDGADLPDRVNVRNLSRVKNGVVMERD